MTEIFFYYLDERALRNCFSVCFYLCLEIKLNKNFSNVDLLLTVFILNKYLRSSFYVQTIALSKWQDWSGQQSFSTVAARWYTYASEEITSKIQVTFENTREGTLTRQYIFNCQKMVQISCAKGLYRKKNSFLLGGQEEFMDQVGLKLDLYVILD